MAIIQEPPLPTWPLNQKHLYLHGHYTRSTYTWLLYNNHLHQYGRYTGVTFIYKKTFKYMAVIQELPLLAWPLYKNTLTHMAIIREHLYLMVIIQEHLYIHGPCTGITFTNMAIEQESPLPICPL